MASEPNNRFLFLVSPFHPVTVSPHAGTQGEMEVFSVDEQQISSGSSRERILKRPRVDEDRGDESEVPTEQCTKHPLLYCEDGNVVLRCEKWVIQTSFSISC